MDKGQEFALNILKKYGWEQGKGLGKNEDGMVNPIKPTVKLNTMGVGYDAGDEFAYHWWNHTFNEVAKKLVVNNTEGEVTIGLTAPTSEISTRRARRKRKGVQYGNFVQSGTLLNDCTLLPTTIDEDKMADDEELDLSIKLTDEELFAKCGKRTGHKAARHGHKLGGKLRRIEEQEKEFLVKHETKIKTTQVEEQKTKTSHVKCKKETRVK